MVPLWYALRKSTLFHEDLNDKHPHRALVIYLYEVIPTGNQNATYSADLPPLRSPLVPLVSCKGPIIAYIMLFYIISVAYNPKMMITWDFDKKSNKNTKIEKKTQPSPPKEKPTQSTNPESKT